MSHLDTAYQLGMKQAEADFQAELNKAAQGPGSAVPGAPTVPTPVNPQVGKGVHNAPEAHCGRQGRPQCASGACETYAAARTAHARDTAPAAASDMSHLDTAYRLGQEKAAADLGELLASGIDNPTMAPPRLSNTKTAVERMVEKLGAKKSKQRTRLVRTPTGKRTNYSAMVRKLKKRRKAAKGR